MIDRAFFVEKTIFVLFEGEVQCSCVYIDAGEKGENKA